MGCEIVDWSHLGQKNNVHWLGLVYITNFSRFPLGYLNFKDYRVLTGRAIGYLATELSTAEII
jgi:hypothetical protein